MVDGMIGRIERETNRKYTVLATGGLAGLIAKHCEREVIYDPDLMIKGLLLIYRRNVKSKSK
jgi:type III pantothenate kinase